MKSTVSNSNSKVAPKRSYWQISLKGHLMLMYCICLYAFMFPHLPIGEWVEENVKVYWIEPIAWNYPQLGSETPESDYRGWY